MGIARVLLVDDDEVIRYSLAKLLEDYGFEITSASSVPDALSKITSQQYDVLLSDLQMPGQGDGLTVVSAMRHANPRAVTVLLSTYPDMQKAAQAILLQADEILVKPVHVPDLLEIIQQRLDGVPSSDRIIRSASEILSRETDAVIRRWHRAVEGSETLMSVKMSFEQRAAYLALILSDLVDRLLSHQPIGATRFPTLASYEHGVDRYRQGYTVEMVIEESRFLQVSIFETLQVNLTQVDFSVILRDVMVIADEIDVQLGTMMRGYTSASLALASGAA